MYSRSNVSYTRLNAIITITFPTMILTYIIFLLLLIGVQLGLEKKRKFSVPDTSSLSDFDYKFKKESLSDSVTTDPFQAQLSDKDVSSETLYTNGKYWLLFAIQKDIAWVGRGILLINSVFFSHAYTIFTTSGANSLYINIFVLMCIFQISFWYYYVKTPIVTILFDREKQAVFIPRYVENPEIFVPFKDIVLFNKKSLLGKEIQISSKITRIAEKTRIKLANDFSEASTFTLYHKPQQIFMRYDYAACSKIVSAVMYFMRDFDELQKQDLYKQENFKL